MKNQLSRYEILFIALFFIYCPAVSGENSQAPASGDEIWSIHFQATTITQGHGYINSPYSGVNSLDPAQEIQTSFTSTLFLGRRLWNGGEIYVNPELSAGNGISSTHGIAGFPNGEGCRVDNPDLKINLSRLFFKQVFGFGSGKENIEPDKNQLSSAVCRERLMVVVGKFSLNDYFDNNAYSHDPRTQFFNWALMDNGAWDYAADTRGYSLGLMLEYNKPDWALRAASVMEPREANMLDMDTDIAMAHGDNLEFEYRYKVKDHPGTARVLAYVNHARMRNYRAALDTPAYNMDITQSREYSVKYGFGLNLEQEIDQNIGAFLRAGWNDGATESWAFTEIDRTLSGGVSIKGASWKRQDDTIGAAVIANGLSADHSDYLRAGGYGFMLGDGKLTYAPEEIFEAYYLWKVFRDFSVTGDVQLVNNPAYNEDRGPVSILGARLHYEF